MLTKDFLKECLSYDPETGLFTWKVKSAKNVKIGSVAGCLKPSGYIHITLNKKTYCAHILAWLYTYGEYPKQDLDHINQVKNCNKIRNLRLASEAQNKWNTGVQANNSSGYKGVSWDCENSKWRVMAMVNGVRKFLGRFDNLTSAITAHEVFCKANHGEFYAKTIFKI